MAEQEVYISVRRHGEEAVVTVSAEIEHLPTNVLELAAGEVQKSLKENPPSNVIVDLSKVNFFGSEFISFLLRCHLVVKGHHGELVIAGASEKVRELLRQTNLDTIWAIYKTTNEALQNLSGD